jgi:protease-4
MASRPGIIRRFFGGLWWLLDGTRRLVFNLLFLALLVLIAVAWWAGRGTPSLQDKTALVLNLRGDLVEQYAGSGSEVLLAEAFGTERRETRVRDVLEALEAAAKDPKIDRAVLVLDDLSGGGTASLREVAAALARFKQSGKQVVAWGSDFSQRQYFLAAHADELYLHPMGSVMLRGVGGSNLYLKDALDKLGVTMHGFQAGKFKSAIEPLTRSSPSPEAIEADLSWMNDLWGTWTAEVEKARKLPSGALRALIDEAPQRLAAVNGDSAQLALKEKLVDGLKTRDEFRALVIERGAPADDKSGTFRQVAFAQYLAHVPAKTAAERIGVVVAQGEILDDNAPPGMIGGRALAETIRRAREDEGIKALVVRIDSPGGSAFGSELVRREIELTRQAGKPVVASMGDVAASGGYWIAMAADEIVADPTTITGSIGVFGVLPTFDKSLDKLGVGAGGAATTWIAAAQSPVKPMDPRIAQMVQSSVEHIYQRFITLAAAGRKTSADKIHEVAQGRVWTGQQAKGHGLVDSLGGLHEAVASAATRAKLADHQVVYLEREPRGLERWLTLLLGQAAVLMNTHFGWTLPSAWLPLPPQVQAELQRQARLFATAHDEPLRTYAYCFCTLP